MKHRFAALLSLPVLLGAVATFGAASIVRSCAVAPAGGVSSTATDSLGRSIGTRIPIAIATDTPLTMGYYRVDLSFAHNYLRFANNCPCLDRLAVGATGLPLVPHVTQWPPPDASGIPDPGIIGSHVCRTVAGQDGAGASGTARAQVTNSYSNVYRYDGAPGTIRTATAAQFRSWLLPTGATWPTSDPATGSTAVIYFDVCVEATNPVPAGTVLAEQINGLCAAFTDLNGTTSAGPCAFATTAINVVP